MKDSLIKDLYYNFVEESEPPHLCNLLNERVDTTIKDLKKVLYNKNRKKLDVLYEDIRKINSLDTDRAFLDGFAFAVKLMSEAYAHK